MDDQVRNVSFEPARDLLSRFNYGETRRECPQEISIVCHVRHQTDQNIVSIRLQFRDFLQLYNKLTEKCFVHCVDNLFSRSLSDYESNCLDKCVLKFSNVNQRVMSTYVREQTLINERRFKEMEQQAQTIAAAPQISDAVASTGELAAGHSPPILAGGGEATAAA